MYKILSKIKDNETPIAKEKPFRLGLIWFLIGFSSSFTIQWTLLSAFDLYKKIFVLSIHSWIYAFVIALVIGALTTAIRLQQYYRKIYRAYREEAFIDDIYINRGPIQAKYKEIIESVENEFFIAGISLHTLIQNPQNREAIIKSVINKKVSFKFLMHSSECKYLKAKSEDENKPGNRISEDCNTHYNQLLEIKKLIGDKQAAGSIEIRRIKDKMPDSFFLQCDNNLYVESYLQNHSGKNCPVFVIKKNNINFQIFNTFRNIMDLKWKNGLVN